MMIQLPYDVQLIVFKYIHKHRLHTVFEDMRIQLRSELPYLRTPIDDCFRRCNFDHCLSSSYSGRRSVSFTVWHHKRITLKSIEDYWQYPYWYFELSDNYIEIRNNKIIVEN